MQPTGTAAITFMFFDTVVCDTGTNAGWNLITFNTATISECAFVNCWGSSFTNAGFQTQQGSTGGSIDGLFIANFRSFNNGHDGFCSKVRLRMSTSTAALHRAILRLASATYAGVHIGANVSAVSVIGMRCGSSAMFPDSQLAQVQVDAGTGTQICVVGCNLSTAHVPITMLATEATTSLRVASGSCRMGLSRRLPMQQGISL